MRHARHFGPAGLSLWHHGARLNHTGREFTSSRNPITPKAQPTVTSEDGTRTLRARAHGERSLPLPPIMDPIAIEARTRHTRRKASQEQVEKSTLTKELEANEFARALATPIRQCQLTKAKLPTHFLLPFSVRLNPVSATAQTTSKQGPRASLTPVLDVPLSHQIESKARSYLLARLSAIEYTNTRSKWPLLLNEPLKEWLAPRLGKNTHSLRGKNDVSWPQKLEDRVREAMEHEVLYQMRVGLRWHWIVNWDQVKLNEPQTGQVGSLIVLEGAGDAGVESRIMQVYRLSEMVGSEVDVRARLGNWHSITEKLKGVETLAVLRGPASLRLRMALDRLQNFIAPAAQ